jgi:tetratricopeptide (TPR) repeat protein
MAEIKIQDASPEVRAYYDKGLAALERENLDYAMDMFEAVLAKEPGVLGVRRLLKAAAVRKYSAGPPRKSAGPKTMLALVKLGSMIRKDPLSALGKAEELLRKDPFNLKAAMLYADAAEGARLPEAAILTFEVLNENRKANPAVLEKLASLYQENNRYEDEYRCRTRITELKPNDAKAERELKNAAARLTMQKSDWKNADRSE